jgi:plastocyanin
MKKMFAALAAAALLAACGGENPEGGAVQTAGPSVELTGEVIEIGMVGIGETYYDPDRITARRGDVLRFRLDSGVHNTSFPADQNPAGVTLPEATPYLQIPGQTHDVTVDLPPGEYFFQCDPHVALGMVGYLTVVE